MAIVITYILLGSLTVFFCLDRAHKIDRNGIGRGLVYSALPVFAATAVCVNLLSGGNASETESMLPDVFEAVVQMLAVMAVTILSAIGNVSVIQYENKYGGDGRRNIRFGKLAFSAALFSSVSACCAAVFCCATSLQIAEAVAAGIVGLIILTAVVTVMTFGIGLVLMALIIPIYALSVGAEMVITVIPTALSTLVWGGIFFLTHLITAAYALSAVFGLFKESRIAKKEAVKYGILSMIPVVNVFAIGGLLKKTS